MAGAEAPVREVPGLSYTPGGYSYSGPAGSSGRAAYQAANPWAPPPIPAGFYNPIRDIEASEGRTSSGQTISGDQRQLTNSENDYATSVALQGEKEGNATSAFNETIKRLGESYKRLQGRQEDQGGATGTLYGGALISAAQKRGANEAVQKEHDQRLRDQQLQAFENERGRAAVAEQQRAAALGESLTNARTNEQNFQQNLNTLKGNEAAQHGYQAPTGPAKATGLFDKINPATRERYREVKGPGGSVIHEYQTGRSVRVK